MAYAYFIDTFETVFTLQIYIIKALNKGFMFLYIFSLYITYCFSLFRSIPSSIIKKVKIIKVMQFNNNNNNDNNNNNNYYYYYHHYYYYKMSNTVKNNDDYCHY